jgi:hypothetical protein
MNPLEADTGEAEPTFASGNAKRKGTGNAKCAWCKKRFARQRSTACYCSTHCRVNNWRYRHPGMGGAGNWSVHRWLQEHDERKEYRYIPPS